MQLLLSLGRRIGSRVEPQVLVEAARRASHSSSLLRVSDEVQHAVSSGAPVVALESTIYTHGYPYPENVELALHLEDVVRTHGAIPATIGVLDGIPRVGLDDGEIKLLAAAAEDAQTMKLSRRDLAYIIGRGINGKKLNGGTTVASTMILAHLAGIPVFATGGLGGVHRGAESTFDISADLTELGRTPVAVISSGCKSFLDIPKTLEYLETQGAFVATFADGEPPERVEFPAFWSRKSGLKSPAVLIDEKEAAAVIFAQQELGLQSGMLFANPVPEADSIPKADLDTVIEEAVQAANASGAAGNLNTPFILKRIREVTGGRSVKTNRALIENNVVRGSKVAVELANLTNLRAGKGVTVSMASTTTSPPRRKSRPPKADIFIAGSIALDTACDNNTGSPALHTSNPSAINESVGGVGLNIARAASQLSSEVAFCSAVADDVAGSSVLSSLDHLGVSNGYVQTLKQSDGFRTARYVAVNDGSKDLTVAMADMAILETLPEDVLTSISESIAQNSPKLMALDGNWSLASLQRLLKAAQDVNAITAFEPVSIEKATRLFPSFRRSSRKTNGNGTNKNKPTAPIVDIATPNALELASLFSAAQRNEYYDTDYWWHTIHALGLQGGAGLHQQLTTLTSPELVESGIPQQAIQLLPYIPTLLVKLGKEGVLIIRRIPLDPSQANIKQTKPMKGDFLVPAFEAKERVYIRLIPPPEILDEKSIKSVNGAGDTFLGVVLAGLSRLLSSSFHTSNPPSHASSQPQSHPQSQVDIANSQLSSLDRLNAAFAQQPQKFDDLIQLAQRGSNLTLQSRESVAENLSLLKPDLEKLFPLGS